MTVRWVQRTYETGQPLQRHLLVDRQLLEALALDCCLRADARQHLLDVGGPDGEEVLADASYVPEAHWEEHGVAELADHELAALIAQSVSRAASAPPGTELPSYTDEDYQQTRRRRAAADVELRLRGYSADQVQEIRTGSLWPH